MIISMMKSPVLVGAVDHNQHLPSSSFRVVFGSSILIRSMICAHKSGIITSIFSGDGDGDSRFAFKGSKVNNDGDHTINLALIFNRKNEHTTFRLYKYTGVDSF